MYVIMNQFYCIVLITDNLRPRNLHPENRLNFIHVGRIVHAISAALNLRDNRDVHITFLREFFLGEFLVTSRLADSITGGFGDILRFLRGVIRGTGTGTGGRGSSSNNR